MITKEKVKKEIDKLSDTEVEKVYLYLFSLRKTKISPPNIRSSKIKKETGRRESAIFSL